MEKEIPKEKRVYVVRGRFTKEYVKHYKQRWRADKYVNRGIKQGHLLDWFEENIDTLNEELAK